MNAKKTTSTILLTLGTLAALVSCGAGKEVDRPSAETLLTNIESNTTTQTKLTATGTASGSSKGTMTTVVNLDEKFIHSVSDETTTSGGSTTNEKVDSYMYLSNSVFYSVDAIAKTYTEEDNAALAGVAWEAAATIFKSSVMNVTTTAAASILSELKAYDSSEPTDVKLSYHSTGDGNITVDSTETQASSGTSKTEASKYVFDKNLLIENDVDDGETKQVTKYSWGNAKVSIPDISKFTKK